MIRTYILPCNLPKPVADALNLESGRIYTQVLVTHYRVYRQSGHWLSPGAAEKLNDFYTESDTPKLHAHSKDAAQQAFYKACKTAKANRRWGANYPHWPKKFRTTIWKNTAIRRKGNTLELANARSTRKIVLPIPPHLQDALAFREVRLVYDKKAHRYTWHWVVENGKQPKAAPGVNIVSVDLGEIHPAVVGDEHEATIITCRKRRHEQQGHAKRLAKINRAISRKQRGSRRHKRLVRTKSRMKAKHKRIVRDMEHKISRAVVDVAVECKASRVVIGDVRDIADGVDLSKQTNQKISGWNHGQVRQLIEYKAQAEGIQVALAEEAYTTQTCPYCGHRHKPRGRIYRCPACEFQAHRDVVGQVNILSVYTHGEPGKIPAPIVIKHRIPHNLRVMRRRRDTGPLSLEGKAVACDSPQEATWLQP